MKKSLILLSIFSLFAISFNTTYSASCINLNKNLQIRSSGAQVSLLQDFLRNGNYLKSQPTGYFGQITQVAVKDFQRQNGINPIGTVGPATRAKILAQSCNTRNTNSNPKPTPSTPSTTPTPLTSPIASVSPTHSQSINNQQEITSCQNITSPGTYVIKKDLVSNLGACIKVHDTSNVEIDCQSGKIIGLPGIIFKNVNKFKLNSCTLEKSPRISGLIYSLQIHGSKDGTLTKNTIGLSYGEIINSENIYIAQNNFNSYLNILYSKNNHIENNTFKLLDTRGITSGVIVSSYGSGNIITNNIIDGGAKGIFEDQNGADDGIVIIDEYNDIVSDNSILNSWDCAIETAGVIKNTVFSNNKTRNSGLCGIGAWYFSSWQGNTVSNNTFEDTKQGLLFFRTYGLRPRGFDLQGAMPEDQNVIFKDNTFTNNVFKNIKSGTPFSPYYINITASDSLSTIPGERKFQESDIVISNNIFRGNSFGINYSSTFNPASLIRDDGGNN